MLYTYTAVDKAGKSSFGEREAESEHGLAEKLKSEGFFLLEIKEKGGSRRAGFSLTSIISFLKGVTLVERMVFSRNLAVMVGAGLSLAKALQASEEQTENIKFKTIISDLRGSVLKGKSFAESLALHEKTFGPLFIHMVESGEASGKLGYVLRLLARQMKRDHDLVSRVRGALIYPAIVIFALILIGVLMMIYVVPTLTATFHELNIPLPFTTRLIIKTSEILINYYLLLLGLILVAAYLAALFLRTERGKRYQSTSALHLPIFGELVRKFNSARFARILSALVSSGLPIARSLEITARVLGNVHFRDSLFTASTEIQKGRSLSAILKERPRLYPPLVTQMLEVGEETGTMSRMLLRLALFYESEVSNATKNLSSIVEPLLMIAIGAMVGFFAISMIQPIYSGLGGL
ncbi:MAG: type II secretion system F family protein [Candidatus Sungbacteria bacterium]|nr:type II secretion system F family protein [Candidatus Sungbacteria bacterium]